MKKIFKVIGIIILGVAALFLLLSIRPKVETISYGVSFSKYHADELRLPWKEAFAAILDDLKVRKFRLSAHWPMVEPKKGEFSFDDLDYQMIEAQKRNATVIFAVGRRLPGWPECHEPDWVKNLSVEEKQAQILTLLETTVQHFKHYKNIDYWQVENEPFLSVFAKEHCGDLDVDFLHKEIALVKKLDPERKVLVTDSGNLGLWAGAWRSGDAFGTSVYMYLWNPTLGQVRSVYLPSFYRVKTNLMSMFLGEKKSMLIELSLEPWLLEPIVDAPIERQIQRMDITKFNEVLEFAKGTGFSDQYLWGAEWWYWMKGQGHPEYWDAAKQVFNK